MNDFINGIPIPSTNHLTGHDIYNNKIGQILTTLSVGNPNPQLSYQKLTDFSSYLRNLIENNQDKNLGQIANLISYP